MFAYRFYAVAKFSLGTAWARVSACLLLPVCLLLLLLRIYASCLRLFNQLFSLTRVRLARSRSLLNYSCTALTALANSLFFSLSLRFPNCFSPATPFIVSLRIFFRLSSVAVHVFVVFYRTTNEAHNFPAAAYVYDQA